MTTPTNAKYWAALGVALVLNASANLLIKFGMRHFGGDASAGAGGPLGLATKVLTSPMLVAGMICFGVNLAFYAYALKKLNISVAYPIMVTLGFVLIVIVAGWKLNERLTPYQWLGAALILVGVWLVASQADRQAGALSGVSKVAAAQSPGEA